MKTRLILVRHGQSTANLTDRFAGHIDVPLTELGIKQGKSTGEFLKNEKIDAFYSSDLQRAYDTACFCAKYHNKPVIKDAGLKEINGGEWENLTYPEIAKEYPEGYKIWVTNIGLTQCPGGESVKDVQNRIFKTVKKIAQEHQGETVFIGIHGMALRAFVLKVLDLPLEKMQTDLFWTSNAAVTYIDYEDGKFTLIKYGQDEHLKKAGLISVLHAKA